MDCSLGQLQKEEVSTYYYSYVSPNLSVWTPRKHFNEQTCLEERSPRRSCSISMTNCSLNSFFHHTDNTKNKLFIFRWGKMEHECSGFSWSELIAWPGGEEESALQRVQQGLLPLEASLITTGTLQPLLASSIPPSLPPSVRPSVLPPTLSSL